MQRTLKNEKFYRNLFLIAALYDFILGFFFFAFWRLIFDHILNMPYPNYLAFYQGAAAFILAMGVGFYFVYLNMYRNIDIVKLGIVFKLFYTGLAFYYVFFQGMPWIFSVFGLLDLIFIVFFVFFLLAIRREVKI